MGNSETPIHVLIDTNALWNARNNFDHPDFRKLLRYSREGVIKVYISKICWEERRTQLIDYVTSNTRQILAISEKLKKQVSNNIVLRYLPEPRISIWSEEDIDKNSRMILDDFADKNKITVIPYAPDHSERAWERYFNVDAPFNPEQERQDRRKDIPDSWILEAAIDLMAKEKDVIAIGKDGALSKSLEEIGCEVLPTIQDVIKKIEDVSEEIVTEESKVESVTVEAVDNIDKINQLLSEAKDKIKGLEIKVLGFITYLDQPTKEQLFEIFEKIGISEDIINNIVVGLVVSNLVKDTGDYYIANRTELSQLAADSVEEEIIKLLSES